MISISVDELCKATNGHFKPGYLTSESCKAISIKSVSIDTRTIKANDRHGTKHKT